MICLPNHLIYDLRSFLKSCHNPNADPIAFPTRQGTCAKFRKDGVDREIYPLLAILDCTRSFSRDILLRPFMAKPNPKSNRIRPDGKPFHTDTKVVIFLGTH